MKNSLLALSLLIGTTLHAEQHHLPPVWNNLSTHSASFDSRVRAYIAPKQILWSNALEGVIEGKELLIKPGNGQSELGGGALCHIKTEKNGSAALLLDFGCELQGGLQIVTGMSGSKGIKLRIRFGESASEAMCDITPKNGATNDHAMRDFTLEVPWLGVAEIGNSGFRFVRIDVPGETDLLLKEVRAIFNYRDIPYRGGFKCSDDRLNQIWQTGAYTVHLNMQEYLWDGIKRDRLVWVGDLHPEIMTVNSVFGYNEVVPKSLDLIRDITPLPGWMNGISSYSIWWLLIHRDWYYYQGKLDYLKEQKGYLCDLIRFLMTKIDTKGKETLDGNRFLDWPSSENQQGVNAGLQAMMVMAMEAGSELATELGETTLANECNAKAKLLKKQVPDHNQSKQGAALMALSGLMEAKEANDRVIAVGGSKNFSTFYGYYMLEAMAKAGNYEGAMAIISEYWGAMLDLGATTFWEDFNMEWIPNASRIDQLVPEGKTDVHSAYGNYCYKGFRHSLCHGWASGPTAWLSRHVLGVKVTKPGCREVIIEPHLGKLLWAEGSFPTPYGDIKIKHTRQSDGTIKSTIDAPKEVKVIRK